MPKEERAEQPTERSFEPLMIEHLARLSDLAVLDHERFFVGHPEYRGRLLAVTLAQGAARHYVDTRRGKRRPNGVKDLDVWTFFAAIPGQRFPADKRETHADFGPSAFGRQRYDYEGVTEHTPRLYARWERYEGRRVDLLMRALPVSTRADPAVAIRAWLEGGAKRQGRRPPSSWHLAQKAVAMIDPADRRGEVVWPP